MEAPLSEPIPGTEAGLPFAHVVSPKSKWLDDSLERAAARLEISRGRLDLKHSTTIRHAM